MTSARNGASAEDTQADLHLLTANKNEIFWDETLTDAGQHTGVTMRGNRVHTQHKRPIDTGLAVQNDRSKRSVNAYEPDRLPFPSSYTRMATPYGPQERGSRGTRRKGPSVSPVQPIETGAERTCADSHHSAKQRPKSSKKPGKAAPANCKIIGVHHALQVELPSFSLESSFFHSIVYYHTKTEGDYVNNLRFELYKKIRRLSLCQLKNSTVRMGNMVILCQKT